MKMDVSKFKKISSDDKKTVLKHPRGHEIVIAHSAVSPSTRKQLHALPGYADGGDVAQPSAWDKFKSDVSGAYQEINGPSQAESPQSGIDFASRYNSPAGGENKYTATIPPLENKQGEYKDAISQYPVPSEQQDAPASPEDQADRAPAEVAPPQESMAPQEQAPEAPATQEEPPTAAIQGAGINPADTQAAAQDKTAAQNYQKGFEDYHRENAQKLGSEDAAWQHDLQNGHVSPQTYHDLFAKRDTLGKVGMLFGLLSSSMGSGLTHQPNAVLDAMNKEIENDYNAQKQSKDNAQNFVKLHQQQGLNEATIKLQAKQGNLTDAQAKAELAQADINSQAAAQMKMNRVAMHNLVLQVQKLPPGPQHDQAEAALAMVGSGIDQKNFNIADVAASKGAMAKMLGGGEGGANTTLLKTMPGMEGTAKDIEEKTVPGVGRAQIPVPQETRDQITAQRQYDQKAKEYVNFAKQHASNWSNLNPRDREAIANQGAAMGANLQSLYRNKIKGGVYKKGEQEFIQQIIPDNPVSWKSSFNAIPKVQQTISDNANDLQTTAKSVGLNVPQPQQSPSGGQTSKSGRPMVQKNGKWYYAK
jgi:hypothetical protein